MAVAKEELDLSIPSDAESDKHFELVNGVREEKIMGGARHGGVGARLLIALGVHVIQNKLGEVYGADTTYKIGGNERLPDISFIAASRIPLEGEPAGRWDFAPDLAVEVISPTDVWGKVTEKIDEYFAVGVRRVWLVAPEHRRVFVYQSPTQVTILTERDELTDEAILPGFRCPLGEIFRLPARA